MADWNALTPEPTSLIALWPHDAAPALDDVVAALARHLGEAAVREALPADDPAVAWSAAVDLPCASAPVLLWAEPAQPLDDHERDALGVADCRWALGVQTLLDRADPLTAFREIVHAIAGAYPRIPAILDLDTTRWYPRAELENVFAPGGIEPAAEVLWTIQLVEGRAGVTWLHTHGLRRCGRPELEMLEVPVARAAQAADLLQDVAGLLLERDVPAPGTAFEIGPDLLVSLRRWEDVAPHVSEDAPGGMSDRAGVRAEAHAGPSAVVCAFGADPDDRTWPRDAVARRARGEATVFVTTRATDRQAALARAAWAHFVDAFAAATDTARFGVKAGFPDDQARGREHLWFEVCRAERDRVEGRLMHEPLAVARLHEGDRTWIDIEQVSDWRILTAGAAFGPDDADRLAAALGGSGERA